MTPTTRGESDPPTSSEVSRRDALKRIAIAGGAVWAVPAIQSINMQRAYAMGGSPTRKCYSVYIDKHYGCQEAIDLDPNVFKCLKDKVEVTKGGCDFIGVAFDPNGDGKWYVTLDPQSTFVAGFSRIAGKCIPSPTPPGSTGIIEFDPGVGVGPKFAIQHIELTYCRQSNSQNAGGKPAAQFPHSATPPVPQGSVPGLSDGPTPTDAPSPSAAPTIVPSNPGTSPSP